VRFYVLHVYWRLFIVDTSVLAFQQQCEGTIYNFTADRASVNINRHKSLTDVYWWLTINAICERHWELVRLVWNEYLFLKYVYMAIEK
jgi:hypothetical protein